MPGNENKQCPRCRRFFICEVAAVLSCQCADVEINSEQHDYIKALYDDCLCRDCLNEIVGKFNH